MIIKIKDAEIEVDDNLGEQICSLIKNSVEESAKEPIKESVKEPYKLMKWELIRDKKIDKSRIQVGTQIDVGCGTSPFVFDVVDINGGICTLVSHYVIVDLPFDAPEPKNPNEDIRTYGSNDYLSSNIRQWLNNIRFGDVFEPKTPYDTPFTNWNYINPFTIKICPSFLRETLRNSDGDKFWLLSEEEFQRFKFFDKKENRRKTDINGVPKSWWLRTPSISTNHYAKRIWYSGERGYDIVYCSDGVVPVCQIKL